MNSKKTYFRFCYIFFICFCFFSQNLIAKVYTSGGTITQYDGPLEASDNDQKVLRLGLVVDNGGGTANCTVMVFNITSGETQILNAELHYTGTTSTYTSPIVLTTVAPSGGQLNFSGFNQSNNANGTYYYWLVINVVAAGTFTANTVVDCSYNTGTYGSGTPTFNTTDPAGFRFTSRNYKIGTGEQYTTIANTASAISRFDYDGADDIFMELTGNYADGAETAAIAFTNHTGPATIIFRPANGQTGKITQFAPASLTGLITFNGVQKIKFDGRANGGDGSIQWTIRNTNVPTVNSSVFTFINDASNNTLTYLKIEGDLAVEDSTGLILFDRTTGTTGNDNNTISYCHIKDWYVADGGNAAKPRNGIQSKGSTGKTNSNNTVDNCQFYDIWQVASATYNTNNIILVTNNDSWTITNNHFYQTTDNDNNSTATTGGTISVFSGGGYTISNNYFGGRAPGCGGGTFNLINGNRTYYFIIFNAGCSGAANSINKNTFSNISVTASAYAGTFPVLHCMRLDGTSNFTIGTSGNENVISSITVTNNSAGGLGFRGIHMLSSGTSAIACNTFGGITVNGTKSGATTSMIYVSGGTVTIDNNTIGSAVANNILISSNSDLNAIYNSSANGITITNNTIQNIDIDANNLNIYLISHNAASSITLTGNTIRNVNSTVIKNIQQNAIRITTGTLVNVSNNNIHDITMFEIDAIYIESTGNVTCSSNNIYNITSNGYLMRGIYISSSASITANSNVIGNETDNNMLNSDIDGDGTGIHLAGSGSYTVANNVVQEFSLTSSDVNPNFMGINISGGTLSATSNTIRNIDAASTKNTGIPALIGIGINDAGTAHNIISNTIQNMNATTATANAVQVVGIYNSTGGGNIKKNLIKDLTNTATSTSASIKGIEITTGDWNMHNNVTILDNSTNTNPVIIRGIEDASTGTETIYHNTVKISGTPTSSAVSTTAFRKSSTSTCTVKNNIFQNLRTGSPHYAYDAANTTTLTTDYNFLEVADDQNKIGNWGGTEYNFTNWKTNSGATNDKNSTETIGADGKPSGFPNNTFFRNNQGTDLSATVTDDKEGTARDAQPWLGSFEGSPPLPLPVGLLFFDAACEENHVKLFWATASETNNDYFTIERATSPNPSKGGELEFESIDIVNGAGNSNKVLNYSTFDNPLPFGDGGDGVYRLKQTDFDGNFEYSEIVAVNCTMENNLEVVLFPNPLSDGKFFLVLPPEYLKQNTQICIYDIMGKVVYSAIQPTGKSFLSFDLSGKLQPGIYTLIGFAGKQINLHQKMVVK